MHYPSIIGIVRIIVRWSLLASATVAGKLVLIGNALLNDHAKVVRSVLGNVNLVLVAIALNA